VFVATSQGAVLIGRRGSGASRAEVIDRELALATVQRSSQETEATFEFDHHGEPYLGRAVPLTIANLRWLVEVVVPERDYTAHVDAEGRLAIGLGVLALVFAVVGGSALAGWIARPLRELAQLARRIRHGELDVTIVPRSRDEIGVLTGAMVEMAGRAPRSRLHPRGLRPLREPGAGRALHARPRGAQAGRRGREVAMLMSDLRDFSSCPSGWGPAAMIGLLNGYLARMTPVIIQHNGTIVEFIGDAIFVLFRRAVQPARRRRADGPVRVAMQDDAGRDERRGPPRGLPSCAWASRSHRSGRGREHRQPRSREVRRGGAGGEPALAGSRGWPPGTRSSSPMRWRSGWRP
jgi:class 3 adenylate cyclase